MKFTLKDFTTTAIIASIYAVLTIVLPFQYGPVQIRIAEALTLLPLLNKKTIYGVVLGCFIANLVGAINGLNLLGFMDVFIGTLATFIGLVITYKFKDVKTFNIPLISLLAPIVVNGVIIGIELGYVLMPNNIIEGSLVNGLYVMIGQLISIVFGYFLVKEFEKKKIFEY